MYIVGTLKSNVTVCHLAHVDPDDGGGLVGPGEPLQGGGEPGEGGLAAAVHLGRGRRVRGATGGRRAGAE